MTSYIPTKAESTLLNFTAIIISVATLASISFAVVIYMESSVLSKRIDDAKEEAKNQQQQALSEFRCIRNMYFDLAKSSFEGLLTTFMSLEAGAAYRKAVKDLRMAWIDINLVHGTCDGQLAAIQAAFKYNKRRFLDIEVIIWEKTEQMEKEESQKVRKYYLALKKKVLELLPREDQQNTS